MRASAQAFFLIVSALFPIVNPLGGSPVFLALTSRYPQSVREALARKIAINSFVLIVASYLIGTHILRFFGISLPVVQVGGGLVVISTGWALLKSGADEHRDHVDTSPPDIVPSDIAQRAFYPLTLPLTVGPGSISVSITLGANAPTASNGEWTTIAAAILGAFAIALSVYLSYSFSDRLARVLGASAMSVILRLTSFLLVCIGVQIFWNGASALLGSLR